MSLISSLYNGTSGLQANSQELAVVGDNLANANTIGFKLGRAAFADALAQSLIGGRGELGLGTGLQAIQRIVSQGALTSTGVSTDLALQGTGYFIVNGSFGGSSGTFYTRAGQFSFDRDGYLVNLDGLRVQGYQADGRGVVGGALGDIQVRNGSSPAQATNTISVDANLEANAPVLTVPWDPANASQTSNYSSSVTIYDSLGTAHQVEVYFRRTAAGAWEWHGTTEGGNVTGGTAGIPSEIASGTLNFDSSGLLTGMTQSSNFLPNGATSPQALNFDFGTPTGAGGDGLDGITQFASPSSTTFLGQDGYTGGQLTNVRVGSSGEVEGVFTNGQTRVLARIAVADFQAADRLERLGGNLLQGTVQSGQPTVGGAGTDGRGAIVSGALEQSNVDMATEFVRMIAAQRGFQANSKTITTADQLLAELMQLKR